MPLDDFEREEVESACDDLYGPGEWNGDDFDHACERYDREFSNEDDF